MCHYIGRKITRVEWAELKADEAVLGFLNEELVIHGGFDYNYMPIIRPRAGTHDMEKVRMQWGFLPSSLKNKEQVIKFIYGFKDETGKYQRPHTTLNVTSEELFSEIYRNAAKNRRCLVPCDGFYEWMHVQVVGKSGKLLKTPERFPYLVQMRAEKEFYMAGIWNPWFDPGLKMMIDTFAIVTTVANSLMKQINNSKKRMPTILPGDLAEAWLYNDLSDQEILDIANYQVASAEMIATPLDKDFLQRANPHEPVFYNEVPELAYS
jgi:putative SOS response-associated peptidase YedK